MINPRDAMWSRDKPKCHDLGHLVILGFPGSSAGKRNLPAMQETWVLSLGWENPLEKEMASHSSILIYLAAPCFSYGAWDPEIEKDVR